MDVSSEDTKCTVIVKEEIEEIAGLQLKECCSFQEKNNSSEGDSLAKNRVQKNISYLGSDSTITGLLATNLTRSDISVKRKLNCDKISVSINQRQNQTTGTTQVSYYIIKPVQQVSNSKIAVNDQQKKKKYMFTHIETKLVGYDPTTDTNNPIKAEHNEKKIDTENDTVYRISHDHTYAVKRSGKSCLSQEVLARLKLMALGKECATKQEEHRFKQRERQRRYREKLKQKQKAKMKLKLKLLNKEGYPKEEVKFVKIQTKNGLTKQACRYEHIMDEVGILHQPSSSCKQNQLHVIQSTEGIVKLGLDSIAKKCLKRDFKDFARNFQDTTMKPSEDRDPLYISPDEFADERKDKESTTIIKEEVDLDLDACELSQEEDLFADHVVNFGKTEIMNLSSNPKNVVLANLKLRNNLYLKRSHERLKQTQINSNIMLFSGSENRSNPTVKEIMKSILNENDTETEELRRNWVKFRSKIYQSRYRARINGRLNMEMEKILQMKVEKYMARMFLDYEEILNNKQPNGGIELAQQFSIGHTNENISQSCMDSDGSNSAITPKEEEEEEDSGSYIIGI